MITFFPASETLDKSLSAALLIFALVAAVKSRATFCPETLLSTMPPLAPTIPNAAFPLLTVTVLPVSSFTVTD